MTHREENRPSVFDRLNSLPAEQQELPPRSRADQLETKSKMRMDAVATPAATAADPEPEPAAATPLQPTVSLVTSDPSVCCEEPLSSLQSWGANPRTYAPINMHSPSV